MSSPLRPRRCLAGAALAVGLAIGCVPDASAQTRCLDVPRAECRRVVVPLDRTGRIGGQLSLFVERIRAPRGTGAPIMAIAGGPGESATSEQQLQGLLFALGRRVRDRRDLIVFDARGTGESGVLNCAGLQALRPLRSTSAAAACGQRLGPARAAYSTVDQMEDIESVRAALDIDRLTLYGTSYGTKVALAYARAHPDRVERLLLDSVVPTDGPSTLSLETLGAMPRVLAEMCRTGCRGRKGRLENAVATLVEALRSRTIRGAAYDRFGRAHRETLDRLALWDLLLTGDLAAELRASLPAGVLAAASGDPALLLRLARAGRRLASHPPSARVFSAGLYAATTCGELASPWDPAAPIDQRGATVQERVRTLGERSFLPFDSETVLAADYVPLCARWPVVTPRPLPATPLPQVPILLLAGSQDLRTPAENARAVLREAPGAELLIVRGAGHSLALGAESRCAQRAAQQFLLARPGASRCERLRPAVSPVAVPPGSINDLRPMRGLPPRVGRTLRAVELTLDDAELALALDRDGLAGGGLHGGSFRARPRGMALDAVEYVPGVRVSSRPRRRRVLQLIVAGRRAARGRLVLSPSGAVRGRLGRTPIRTRLKGGPPDPNRFGERMVTIHDSPRMQTEWLEADQPTSESRGRRDS